jgi:hypothetical protein
MFIFKKLNIVENNNAEIKQFSLHKEFTGCITKNIVKKLTNIIFILIIICLIQFLNQFQHQ